jgi:hypothetical protein
MADTEQLRPSLFVLVDALGWEILRERPFLDDVLTERQRVETILGYSSGAIPSLLSGRLPAEHGHWNLFYRAAPKPSPFRWTEALTRLPRSLRESRVTRRLVMEISRRLTGYTGYFQIYNLPLERLRFFDICEPRDIFEPAGLSPVDTLFDILRAAGVPYECFNYHRYTDEAIFAAAAERLATCDSRLFFAYLSGLDAFLHYNVHDPRAVDVKLAWYEQRLRRLYEAAVARWGGCDLRVFSDHGMTPTRETRDLAADVRRLSLRVPDDYLPLYDSTMARFWCHSPASARQLQGLLQELPYGRLLAADELHQLGVGFPDHRYGELVFVMKPGALICPSDMGRYPLQGMHGYDPRADPHAAAVFLSNGPGTKVVPHITAVLPRLLADLGLATSEIRPPGA